MKNNAKFMSYASLQIVMSLLIILLRCLKTSLIKGFDEIDLIINGDNSRCSNKTCRYDEK